MKSIRERIDAFMGNDSAKAQYETVVNKGQVLQQKQQSSLPLSGEEVTDFERDRDALLANPVATGFMDAQQELHQMQESIQKYVHKTLELGRVPTEEDLCDNNGGCGSGCGCHH
jgi:cell fate (sporulation/competence/biofilm development) regulator YlbF (YheA/YmcA/DUF963 family)